jgi:2-polyprenyl-6-methoxyphenol hydroxylase-like FAD-dependent oxidoreductase
MYDVIIVGARCAGAPTAMLLAKQGHRVLLVDRSKFPSDIMSTHFIQPHGIERLQRWGLLDKVAATNCPPIRRVIFNLPGGVRLEPPPPPDDQPPAYCPRRTVLDTILVDAAVAAGAELREEFSVQEIVMDGDRVTGIRGRTKAGAEVAEDAKFVVGADGLHSVVARAVKPEKYHEYPSYTCAYYNYFSGVPLEGAEFWIGEGGGCLAFPTNDDLSCLAVGKDAASFADYKKDIEGTFYATLDSISAEFAARVRAGKPTERWIGTADVPNFFAKPSGPGWALVGDAGYHRDPITGLGIAEAFRDTELLAEAIDETLSGRKSWDKAGAEYQRKRDEAAMPAYEFTVKLASDPGTGFATFTAPQPAT